jgi:hypothetical protein
VLLTAINFYNTMSLVFTSLLIDLQTPNSTNWPFQSTDKRRDNWIRALRILSTCHHGLTRKQPNSSNPQILPQILPEIRQSNQYPIVIEFPNSGHSRHCNTLTLEFPITRVSRIPNQPFSRIPLTSADSLRPANAVPY